MITQETLERKIAEYFEGVQKGDFNDISTVAKKYDYGHLLGMFFAADKIKNGTDIFKLFYSLAMEYGKQNIKNRIFSGEKIKVAFVAISAAEWPVEDLYRLISKDDRFDTYIVNVKSVDKDEESAQVAFDMNKEFFEKGDYNYVNGFEKGRHFDWSEMGGFPDICINLTSWFTGIADNQCITSMPLSTINVYIPYGFYVADTLDGKYAIENVYNKEFMSLMYRIYIDSYKNLEGFKKYSILNGINVIYSGYTKMDYFYQEHDISEKELRNIWKVPEGNDFYKQKKVIIAPHFSMGNSLLKYSTFDKNFSFLLYLAKKYPEISFVFKPHPNVRNASLKMGLFKDMKEYDDYIREWKNLPNANVIEEGSYLEMFLSSDAMILDSASFIAEYLYVNKPLLFLTRYGQAFNELGRAIYDTLYKTDGRDYFKIEEFLINNVLGEKDENYSQREKVFENNLDYGQTNGRLASETIYEDIVRLLG